MPEAREYRIDELAREAGTTVRNVRAYQDRGLLPAPRRQGRVGLYSETHLARLRLIASLLERGYTLANIAELLAAWEQGQDVAALLGFEAALAAPWSDTDEVWLDQERLAELLGGGQAVDPGVVDRAVELGLLERHGSRLRVVNPSALQVGALLMGAGVPLEAILEAGRRLQADVDDVARQFVDLVDIHVFGPRGEPPAAEEIPGLADLVRQLRPLSKQVVEVELSRAMERHVRARFGQHLERFAASRQRGVSDAAS